MARNDCHQRVLRRLHAPGLAALRSRDGDVGGGIVQALQFVYP